MGRFLWERERPARKSAGKMPVCAPDWANALRHRLRRAKRRDAFFASAPYPRRAGRSLCPRWRSRLRVSVLWAR